MLLTPSSGGPFDLYGGPSVVLKIFGKNWKFRTNLEILKFSEIMENVRKLWAIQPTREARRPEGADFEVNA